MIYVVIPIHNRVKDTLACLECISSQTYKKWQVVICDDGSTDGSRDIISQRFRKVQIVSGDGSYWWTRSVNVALEPILNKAKASDFVFVLNNDVTFSPDTFTTLLALAKRNPKECIGTTLQTSPHAFEVEVTIDWNHYRYSVRRATKKDLQKLPTVLPADTLPCRGTLVPVSLMQEIGTFDERSLPHYAADYEFFLRAKKAGYDLCVATQVVMVDQDKGHKRASHKSFGAFYQFLFGLKSPYNIKNNLVIIFRYCPGWWLKIVNALRVIIGVPIAYIKS